jgi:hypothetical protein
MWEILMPEKHSVGPLQITIEAWQVAFHRFPGILVNSWTFGTRDKAPKTGSQ